MHAWLIVTTLLAAGPVDFDADVQPILTKAGCNAAACHGAAAGRGGFVLSLYGARPGDDYNAIVRDRQGRRVHFLEPEKSLLLAKPTGALEHGGDVRLDADGPHAATIAQWIREGAQRRDSPALVRLVVTPAQSWFAVVPGETQLAVAAINADGARRDVRHLAAYSAADESAAEISDDGRVTLRRRGRHVIIVRFATEVTAITLTAPLNDEPVDLTTAPRANFVDDEIYATLRELRLPLSPAVSDEAFLRRVRLDLTGRLPTPAEVQQFIADEHVDKRSQLVDRLLASPDFTDYWTHRLATWLRIGAPQSDGRAAKVYRDWVRAGVAAGTPLDEMASALVTGDGDSHIIGPANFYRAAGDAREQAEYFSEVLLGVRLRCANCHNHPLDRWTQDDYHGLAAIFAKLDRSTTVRYIGRGDASHPATGEAAVPRIPGDRNLAVEGDHRAALAAWLVAKENPYFTRAMVNRLWAALMGRGLVEPVDDFRATNPPALPKLLDELAADFVAHDYNLRHTLRIIATSAAYRRSSESLPGNKADEFYYSHMLTKPLSPEVRLDAISDVTGLPFDVDHAQRRAINYLGAGESPLPELDELGRCSRTASCETPAATANLARQLALLNGGLLNRQLESSAGRLTKMLALSDEQLVEQSYLLTLSRRPTTAEAVYWRKQLADDQEHRRACVEDFVWSLLNCDEFVHNH